MKRWRALIVLLLLLSFAASLAAAIQDPTPKIINQQPQPKTIDPIQFLSGSHSLGAHVFEKVVSTGLLKLRSTTITQSLRVEGSLIAQSARLGTLDVTGEASLSDSIIASPCTITGTIRTQNTTFQSLLTLGAQKAFFASSHLHSITIRKDLSYKGKQLIELKQKTIVDGPITFESGRGEVHLYPGSQVLGPVTGGKVVRKG
ncbi:MAG TPA: hypothetical protein VGM34_00330 [Chlamydiales bacterium]|jgi:hypothetical protein